MANAAYRHTPIELKEVKTKLYIGSKTDTLADKNTTDCFLRFINFLVDLGKYIANISVGDFILALLHNLEFSKSGMGRLLSLVSNPLLQGGLLRLRIHLEDTLSGLTASVNTEVGILPSPCPFSTLGSGRPDLAKFGVFGGLSNELADL